ncbi:cytochrome P450 [Frankia sp. CNm7]|uniref:Cytochrome P450 n=1 Tax=Frankia nepalensis TaxID=1836974 RepID=A0A937RTJ1_9ACTN|nr:cytochrome P450 [Frankia nepalensis]MBL7495319.1 cytochrome P450 [Frankia nepalensis]MBL7508591.1 cytochrome P450 [Frankia nepalensis]MBL7520060.1 cytochrome P450 [Frankia nepalensis]MBL7632513.1 cytochrome P450 [Frankia nepalensis]
MTNLSTPLATAAAAALPSRYPTHVGATRLYGDDFHRDVAGVYRDLRARYGAVAPALLDGDVPVWLVLGYREAHFVLTRPELFDRDGTRWNALDLIPPDWPQAWVLGADSNGLTWAGGEEHARRSTVLHDALAEVDLHELRARCERDADALIDAFAADGSADLMAEFAQQLPARVFTWLVGFPAARQAAITRDSLLVLTYDAEAMAAQERLTTGLAWLVAERAARPAFDVTSRMTHHPLAGPPETIVPDLRMVIAVGQQPTAHWIGNTLRLMLADPRFATTLAGGRNTVRRAMAEVLWEDAPTANTSAWWAVRACDLGAFRIQPGDMMVLGVAGAHTDPHIRPNGPAALRGNQAHLAFLAGPHRCPLPAQEIAEIIVAAALEVLLDRLPDVSLAVPSEELGWAPSPWIRGLTQLPVLFNPI